MMREMIMASDERAPRGASTSCCRCSSPTSTAIFEAMAGLPVTIRLLDPPLHDSCRRPRMRATTRCVSGQRTARDQPDARHPRLPPGTAVAGDLRDAGARDRPRGEGRRGRTGAAPRSRSCTRSSPSPRSSNGCASSPPARSPRRAASITCGTMIELPRACVRADEIAEHADFFSFGTNDLTQTALGFSRDDAEGTFLSRYLDERILVHDPFQTLDQSGVGDLMRIAIERGRSARPGIRLGICGEHGGDPAPSSSATGSGSTTSPAPPTASRSRGSWRRRPHFRRKASVATSKRAAKGPSR